MSDNEKRGNIDGLVDIWYYSEVNHKNSIFNYLKDFDCDDDTIEAGLGMIKIIDNTIIQIKLLKEMGKC